MTNAKNDSGYLLVSTDVCPEVLLKTIEAKKLIELYGDRPVTDILKEVGLGKSAFYKYRNKIYTYESVDHDMVVTLYFVVDDYHGILAAIINKLSKAKGNILTINQNVPIDGLADVTVSLDTSEMKRSLDELMDDVCTIKGVRRAQVLNRKAGVK